MRAIVMACLTFGLVYTAQGQTITIDQEDAVVWGQDQIIEGSTDQAGGILKIGGEEVAFTPEGGAFSVPVWIREGTTEIVACTSDEISCPDTLRLTLGYELRPELSLTATATGRTVELDGSMLANPDSSALTFKWVQDANNPAQVMLSSASDTTASVDLPEGTPFGEYYFDLLAISDDTVRARTFVTVDSTGVTPFDIRHDHAAWVDAAVVYGVTPYNMDNSGDLQNVTARLPEIADLGVNTLWILPIYTTADPRGPGYWVTNFFQVRRDYGTEEDFRNLVEAAHARGMKVLLDFVPNHTHIDHPYAQDAIAHGDQSHYYDFYQRTRDDAPYSNNYRSRTIGNMSFLCYFDCSGGNPLPMLNFDNPEVQRWITEAARYWIEDFDIDGYRIDVAWGPRSRNPEFMQQWRLALKREKPGILLLGEDTAADSTAFDAFDAAYDWYVDRGFVSHWTWQTEYTDIYAEQPSKTIFNYRDINARTDLLRDALTNEGQGWDSDAMVFRFIENNDTRRFILDHGPARTKMAASLVFSLPGLPLIFNGQEVGMTPQPYANDSYPIFYGSIADAADPYGLYPYYQHLIDLREMFPAFRSDQGHFAEMPLQPADAAGHVYAYRRWEGDENAFGVINMGPDPETVTLSLPINDLGLEDSKTYYFNDVINGTAIAATGAELASVSVDVPGYTTELYVLADSAMDISVSIPADGPGGELPAQLALEQNYPNPFRQATTLAFSLPRPEHVRLAVYDVLGRQVAVLQDGQLAAGHHQVDFEADGLASGMYFYRLEAGDRVVTKRMLLVR
ncbi:MAG TPA: alpha-amylase family glycosyl hydrolase [Rhodothermales bacterium]|nr:alpha-amylase family glycosyl hydrolase [Rhodothermales bacterium]